MYLIRVIPLSSSYRGEALSYFSKLSIPKNALVVVPLRKKPAHAIVVDSEDVRQAKSAIRTSDFGIKKVERVVAENPFSNAFIEALQETADTYNISLGAALQDLIPNVLLQSFEDFPKHQNAEKSSSRRRKKPPFPKAIQMPFPERVTEYERIAEGVLDKHQSVFIVIPNRQAGERILRHFENHFSSRLVFLHGSLPKKKLRAGLKKTHTMKSLAYIGTPRFLACFQNSFDTIILEAENNETYRTGKRPYIDTRFFAEKFAEYSGAKLFLGASVLSTETAHRIDKAEIVPHRFFETSFNLPKKTSVIDMRPYRKDEKGFAIFSSETKEAIKQALLSNKKIFLFSARKGLSGVTVCGDCETTILCPDCSSPLILEENRSIRQFRCNACGGKTNPKTRDRCLHCGGFNLKSYGIGSGKVAAEVKRIFPSIKIVQIDGETTTTHQKTLKEAEKFNENEETVILVGTEKALPYIENPADLSVVVSLDSLFALPHFRIGGKIFQLLREIAFLSKESLIIQTRDPKSEILDTFLKGRIDTFHKNDLEHRKRFGFPPFLKFIKITGKMKPDRREEQIQKLEKFFSEYDTTVYPGLVERVKKKFVIHALIRLPADEPLSDNLRTRLNALPLEYEIRIDPESVL